MSITLKPWAVVLLVATFGILIGFTAGQVTSATSSGNKSASISATDYQVVSQLKKINSKLGATYNSRSVLGMLDDLNNSNEDIAEGVGTSDYLPGIRSNTYEMCKAVKGTGSC